MSQQAYTADFLLSLLDSIAIPQTHYKSADITYELRDGWKVVIFYDCGELDYIDSFIDPMGVVVDFWSLPEESLDCQRLINWRGHAQ